MSQEVDSRGGYAVLCWLGAAFVLSAIYRLVRRRPVLFFSVADADFLERGASGGNARNCLVVAVSAGRLIVRPFFPFNLLFLPEVYGLEFDTRSTTFFGRSSCLVDAELWAISCRALSATSGYSYVNPTVMSGPLNCRLLIQRPSSNSCRRFLRPALSSAHSLSGSVSDERP